MFDTAYEIPEPPISRFLFSSTALAPLWLFIRLYAGVQWLIAGLEKIQNPAWVGLNSGMALQGFIAGALKKSAGALPDVSGWYASFLSGYVAPHASQFSVVVSYGEVAVGIGLILGLFTGIAAFFGGFMNMNYLFAGTVSSNPLLFLLELFLILAWRVAGWIGLDRFLLPLLGTPWKPGKAFRR